MPAPSPTPLSGQQYELKFAEYRATIASVGATLRTLSHGGHDLIVPFSAGELRPGFRGATLAPWPNRVADGRYSFGGSAEQLALTEPERNNALHGLACWLNFAAVELSDSAVTLAATIEPQPGYPHRLELSITFSLTASGLSTELTALNVGATVAPYGAGFHPYLRAGDSPLEEWMLQLDAAKAMIMDPGRMVPLAIEPVEAAHTAAGTALDFRLPQRIGAALLDHPFTGLGRQGGLATATLLEADGSGVRLSWDARCEWVQVFTDDQGAGILGRLGLAVEPISCPPNAFNSGVDLLSIAPGASASVGYLISVVPPSAAAGA